jgi:hypothetical protein
MIGVFLVIVLLAGIILYAVIAKGQVAPRGRSGNRASYGKVDKAFVAEKWQAIEFMSTAGGSGLRNAVSEADKLFDYVLKGNGYVGDTMAERLKRAESRLTNRNGVWAAHKLRNALAHEVAFDLVASQAKDALKEYKRGLIELKAL